MKNKKLYFTCALLMILLGTSDALRGIFSPLFLKEFGLSMSQISIIVSASYLGNLVCLLFGGVILDKVGSKKAMVGFIILLICSELLLLLGAKYAFLLLGFFFSLGLSTLLNTTMIFLSREFSAKNPLFYLNVLFFLQGIGTSLSQLVLTRFSSSLAVWNGVIVALAVLLIPVGFILLTSKFSSEKQEENKSNEGSKAKVNKGAIALLALSLAFYLIAEHGVTNYIVLYGTEFLKMDAGKVGLMLSLFSFGILSGRLILATVSDELGGAKMVFICLLSALICYSIVFAFNALPLLFLCGFAVSIVYPTLTDLSKSYVPSSMSARATTIVVSLASILDIGFNFLFGSVIESIGYAKSMAILPISLLLSTIIMLSLLLVGRKKSS